MRRSPAVGCRSAAGSWPIPVQLAQRSLLSRSRKHWISIRQEALPGAGAAPVEEPGADAIGSAAEQVVAAVAVDVTALNGAVVRRRACPRIVLERQRGGIRLELGPGAGRIAVGDDAGVGDDVRAGARHDLGGVAPLELPRLNRRVVLRRRPAELIAEGLVGVETGPPRAVPFVCPESVRHAAEHLLARLAIDVGELNRRVVRRILAGTAAGGGAVAGVRAVEGAGIGVAEWVQLVARIELRPCTGRAVPRAVEREALHALPGADHQLVAPVAVDVGELDGLVILRLVEAVRVQVARCGELVQS